MNIKEYVENYLINNNESEAEILSIFKTGSQLFHDKPNDLDFIVVVENFKENFKFKKDLIDDIRYDIWIMDKAFIDSQLKFEEKENILKYEQLFNYLYIIREPFYGYYKPDWDIFSHKEKYLSYIKSTYFETLFKSNVKWKFSKMFVHYYIVLTIFENNSTEITDEMLINIEQLYNKSEENNSLIDSIHQKIINI